MIRINLLQGTKTRKAKGQWDVRIEVGLGVAILVLTLGFCLYYSMSLGSDIEARKRDYQQKLQQVATLKQKVQKVQDFEKKKKKLEQQNKIIERLEKRRGGPVKILDVISRSLEPLRVWVVSLSVGGSDGVTTTLKGKALSNDDVVAFVNSLRRGDVFKGITLKEIRSTAKENVKVFNFTLSMEHKS